MRYSLHHFTKYFYSGRVSYSQHLSHLRPLDTTKQKVNSYRLEVSPKANSHQVYTDYFGNFEDYFSLTSPHDVLTVDSYAEIEINPATFPTLDLSPPWEEVRDQMVAPISQEAILASEYCYSSKHCPQMDDLAQFAQKAFTPGKHILHAAKELNELIHNEFSFDAKATTVSTSVEDVFRKRAGVCQDFAHLQISALRSIGLAARYVSGYIRTEPPKGGSRLIGADASHAWIALYIPHLGWIEYDSTNNVSPTTDHITVAYGRDYDDICPIRGIVYGGGSQTLEVGVTLTPLN